MFSGPDCVIIAALLIALAVNVALLYCSLRREPRSKTVIEGHVPNSTHLTSATQLRNLSTDEV